jgi:hypothetical protein
MGPFENRSRLAGRYERGRQQRPSRQPEKPESQQRNRWAPDWTLGFGVPPRDLSSQLNRGWESLEIAESGGYGGRHKARAVKNFAAWS